MTMTNQNKPSYNTLPHYIAREYRSGELNINQLRLLFWLRAIGTPYGIATTSLTDLKNDVFPDLDLKINTINSMLLKLRQKQHVFYEPRQGKSGTFEVQLNHWFMPKKRYKTLDKFFATPKQWMSADGETIIDDSFPQVNPSEASQKLGTQNQKLKGQKQQLVQRLSASSGNTEIRSYHTEHDTEMENKNEQSSTPVRGKQTWNKNLTNSYEAQGDAERRCKDIALEVGDKYMDFILSALHNKYGGLEVIEEALDHYHKVIELSEEKENDPIVNTAAFFNSCVTSAIYDHEDRIKNPHLYE